MTLPAGVVAFLFTDVEGSTRLLQELGPEAFARVNDAHRSRIREVLRGSGGVEVSTHGDSFFCVFAEPSAAVAAAGDMHDRLREGPVRVRIGVHVGEAVIADDTYVGLDVNVAARVADAAHGGQTLATERAVAALPDGSDATPLAPHRLKDVDATVRLWQVGDGTFPPPRAARAFELTPHAVPLRGRRAELRDLSALLADHEVRLLTLVGAGGVGKTRLAHAAVESHTGRWPDGAVWVPLDEVSDGDLVAAAVGRALGVPAASAADLGAALGDARVAVVLDNAEHVRVAVGEAAAALLQNAGVVLVTTSREPLGLPAERVWPVPPLDADDGLELFRAAVARLDPTATDDAAAAALVGRLDGIPLAIELAAAQAAILSPGAVLQRLDALLDASGAAAGGPARHRTLRATIGWSYDLMDDAERRGLARLSIFPAPFRIEAAEAVGVSADVLVRLVRRNMIRRSARPGYLPRFSLLETVRAFAFERLDESDGRVETEAALDRWCEAFLTRADASGFATMREDSLDVPIALAAAARASGRHADDAFGFLVTAARFVHRAGAFGLALPLYEQAAALDLPPQRRTEVLALLANAYGILGRRDDALAIAEEAVEVARAHDEGRLITALHYLSTARVDCGLIDGARAAAEEALTLAEAQGDPKTLSLALIAIVNVLLLEQKYEEAVGYAERAASLGDDPVFFTNLAIALACTERPGAALEAVARGLDVHERLHMDDGAVYEFVVLAYLARDLDPGLARELLAAVDDATTRTGFVIEPVENRLRDAAAAACGTTVAAHASIDSLDEAIALARRAVDRLRQLVAAQ